MKSLLSGLNRFYLPLAAFFLLLIPFGLYFFFYVAHQERYYTRRNVRDLAVVSRQISEQVRSYQRVLQNRADYVGNLEEGERTQQSLEDYIENRVPGLSYVKPDDGAFLREDVTLVRGDRGFELYFRAAPKKKPAGEDFRLYAKTSLQQFVDRFSGRGEFESILLLDGEGTVLYQSEHPELRATKIAKLGQESATASTGVTPLVLGDIEYLAFIQPVELTIATDTAAADPASGNKPETEGGQQTGGAETRQAAGPPPGARQRWVVCGLVAEKRFDSETRAVSYSVVIWFVFFLAVLTLLAPFLKLRFLAPTERLPRWEAPKLLVAVLLGAAAVSVCILDVYYYHRLIDEVDQSLESLADRMESNFTSEVTRAYLQLVEHDRRLVEVGEYRELGEKTARGCGDEWPLGGILNIDQVDTETYPYLGLIFWADDAGNQKIKWSVREEPTTFIPVGRREYFRRVRDHDRTIRELPSLRTQEGNVGRFWLESLFSWTTGAYEVVISTGVQDRGCSDGTAPLQMVAGVFQPLSVMEPVLPRGYGFAIVDWEGRVLLHSDKRRVLSENFFTEADEKRELRSAVQGGIRHSLAIRYFGKDHRAHVRPLTRLEGLSWSLIVFHPMKPLRTLNLEVLTLTAVLFGVYLIALLVAVWLVFAALLGGLLWFSDPGKALWVLWPDKKKIGIYWRLSVFYVGVAVLFSVWIAISTGLTLLIGAVLIPLYAFLYVLLADWFKGEFQAPRPGWTLLRRSQLLLPIALLFFSSSAAHFAVCVGLLLAAFLLEDETAGRWVRGFFHAESLKPYFVRFTASIVVLAVLPCVAFFKFGYRLERHLWQMHSQQEMAADLQARSARVRTYYDSILPVDAAKRAKFLSRRLHGERLDVYAGFDQQSPVKPCGVWSPCVKFNACKEEFDALPSADGWRDANLRNLFQPVRPLYDDFAGSTWPLLTPSSSVRMVRDEQGRRWIHTLAADESVEVRSPAASMEPRFGWSEAALLAAWLLLLYALHWGVRFIARMVFLIDLPAPKPRQAELDPKKEIRGNLFIFGHPRSGKTKVLTDRNDIYAVDVAISKGNLGTLPRDKAVAIDQFEYQMDDPEWNQEKLRMLEHLVDRRAKDKRVANPGVVIVSTIDPIFYLATGGSGKPVKNGEEPDWDLDRWANVLSTFDHYDFEDWTRGDLKKALKKFSSRCTPPDESRRDEKGKAKQVAKICEFLRQECRWTTPLREAAEEVISKINKDVLPSRKELADQIYDRCEAYYRSLWSACSKAEKRMLIQLAEEGVLNRKEERVVRHLMKKGLIDRRPRLGLLNETFRRFILNVKEEEDFKSWEQEDAARGWAAWRSALIVVLVTIVVFLGTTQREILESWIPILGAIATGVVGILRIFSLFRRAPTVVLEES